MDDFGNSYQDEAWAYGCEQFSYSQAVYGMLSDEQLDWCMHHGVCYWAHDI